jgi:hypothetical protein
MNILAFELQDVKKKVSEHKYFAPFSEEGLVHVWLYTT